MSVRRSDVDAALRVIAPFVRRTPLVELSASASTLGTTGAISLKLELLQRGGSFKTRGAFHHLLTRTVPKAGVAAASGGNHGVATALAAQHLGHRATIFVPTIASPVKVQKIRDAGADVISVGERYADAQLACDAYMAETGAMGIHPYDDECTVAGAGTVAAEWEHDLATRAEAPLDTVLVAVGGGGLAAGLAAYLPDSVQIVTVEPEGSRCLHAALQAGAPVDVSVESVAADSLGAKRVGALPFQILRERRVTSVLVPDDAIRRAMALLLRELALVAEPGGGAALGALLAGAYRPAPRERVGVLVCGGNVGLDAFAALSTFPANGAS
ncbi:MAG: serine/threonine dehydratase [Myxococcales bacterium]|nr:serine/threonine dehydratase [Myxococcales bacterium]